MTSRAFSILQCRVKVERSKSDLLNSVPPEFARTNISINATIRAMALRADGQHQGRNRSSAKIKNAIRIAPATISMKRFSQAVGWRSSVAPID
jgi:Arc/MetJ family transcription regulator